MFSHLLIIGLLCAVAYPNPEDDICGNSIKNLEESDCIITSDCTVLDKLDRDDKVVYCGLDDNTGAAKVCCPKRSLRFGRQAAPKKDPQTIVQRKCNEYSAARYVIKRSPSNIPGRPDITWPKLECVLAEPLIVNGALAKLKEFPHMALIGLSDRPDKSVNDTEWACGGSLISDRYVLTAAHCLRNGNYEARWVRLGELVMGNDSDSAQPRDFRIAERIPHPKYNPSSVYFDIMLLKLRDRVSFTPHMRPICLYTSSVLAPALRGKAVITGWGQIGTGEQKSEPLLKGKVNFTNDNECVASYRGDNKLANGYDPNAMVCAGDKVSGNDTCNGDSGGPLQVPIPEWSCMYSQIGITSYGARICGDRRTSTIYTKVSFYIPWIQSIVWP